ncbi:hypothetical protein PybrP1_010725 [[Pythium] brassicae (nom. inval.)]|nr:hypothetical protein PybrP1_010725 [[Pythium] brassicae (nom. inval.)]
MKRVTEFQELCRTHAQSVIRKKRNTRIRTKIRELLLHAVFLYFYSTSTSTDYSRERLFRFASSPVSQYAATEFEAPSSPVAPAELKSLYRIASATELFAWLKGPFLALSYPHENSADALVFQNSRVVGGIRLGQLRATRSNCVTRVTSYFGSLSAESSPLYCYGTTHGDFGASAESVQSFGGTDGAAFPFAGLNGTDTLAERATYYSSMSSGTQALPAPAFSVVLPRADRARAAQVLEWLERDAYIDAHTRVAMLDVNLFNAMLRRVLVLRFVFEFPASGGVVPSAVATSAPLAKSFLFDAEQLDKSVCDLAVLGFYAYFLASELLARTGRRRKAAALRALKWSSRDGSGVRVLSLLFYVLVWTLRLVALVNFPGAFPLETDTFVSLRAFAEPVRVAQHLLAVNTCVCWLVLLLLLRVSDNIDVFVRTVLIAKTKLLSLLVCMALLVLGYANALVVAVGGSHDSQGVGSVGAATRTLLELALGAAQRLQQPQTDHLEPDATVRSALLVGFLLLNALVLSNLFLVVLYEAYRTALEDTALEQQQSGHGRVHFAVEVARYAKALCVQLRERLAGLRVALRARAGKSLEIRAARLSVVHGFSPSPAPPRSAKLLASQVGALNDAGCKPKHTVVSSAREDDADKSSALGRGGGSNAASLRGANRRGALAGSDGGSRAGRRSPERGDNDGESGATVKLLQGMILQLALQNESLIRSLEEVRADVKSLTALSAMDGSSRHTLLSPASQSRLSTKRKQSALALVTSPSRSANHVELLETLS